MAVQHAYTIPEDIREFAQREDLDPYLTIAVDLIRDHFPGAGPIEYEIQHGQETDEDWIALRFAARGEMEALLDHYDRCTDALVERIPWPQRDKLCLSFSIE
jgi:hypothetical protein